jgi:zinc protease
VKRTLCVAAVLAAACSGHPPKTNTVQQHGHVDTPPEQPMPLWDQVKKGTLPNGLTYYVLPHAKPEGRVYLWLAVNAGSVQEDDDQRGLAHLCEHMAFNGTKRFEKSAIVDYIEKIGMNFGADLNAYTDQDETVYQLQVPTDDPTYVDTGLDILRDWAGDVTYDPDEVKKERGVVMEEWRLDQGAGMRLYEKQSKVLLAGTRYPERITIGDPDIIKNAERDVTKRFYDDWYRPDLEAVVVVGEIDPDKIAKMIEAKFGDLKNPEHEREKVKGGVPDASGTRISIEQDAELPQTYVEITNTFAHRSESTRSDLRRAQVEQLFHLMLNERLQTIMQGPDSPFVWANSSTSDLNREAEGWSRSAGVKTGKVEDALTVLFQEVLRVEKFGFTQTELDRAKKQYLRGITQSAKEIDKRDGRELVQEALRNYFQGEEMPGREAEAEVAKAEIPNVTLDEMNKLGAQYGGDDNRVIEIAGPKSETLPDKARVKEIIAGIAKSDLKPWVDEDANDELMKTKPTPGTVTAETVDKDHGVTTWTLSNGVKVMVKPTDFETDTVMLDALSPGGTAQAKDDVFPSARFAAEVIGAGGLGTHTDVQVDKLLAGKVADVYPWIDETEEGVRASSSVDDLETMLQLVNLTMTAPRKDEQAFAVWKQSTKQWATNRRLSPETAFYEDMRVAYDSKNPRRKPPEPDDVDKVDLDQAMAFYQDRFGDAGDFTFVIVGNVDVATLKPLVEQYLASLPATARKEKEKDIGVKHPKGVTKKEETVGTAPKAAVTVTMYGKEKWTRDGERDIETLAGVLDIRLREVLREDMSGTYGVGVWGDISRIPVQERRFAVQFGCAPENVDKLIKAMWAEIKKVAKSGIGDTYLDKIRETMSRNRQAALVDNGSWAGWLEESARTGDDLTTILDLEGDLARVSSANVKAAAKKYADDKQYFLGIMKPAAADQPAK